VELAILELLAEYGPLAVDRIADSLNEPEREVGACMWLLAHRGFVRRVGATCWRLTDAGRDEARHWLIA
jgi:DNA-binding IclR family transcriptional regulator